MTISIKNLNAALGAEIAGVDATKPIAAADVDAIEAVMERTAGRGDFTTRSSPTRNSSPSAKISANSIRLGRTPMASRSSSNIPSSTSSPMWSKMASQWAISATAKRSGMRT